MPGFRCFLLSSALASVVFACFACSAPADTSGADGEGEPDVVTIDGRDQELGSCFPNTHSVGGRHICLEKQANGRYVVDCRDGRRAIVGDYNWALQYCDPSPPALPPPPKPTSPNATCSAAATTDCKYRVGGRVVGVCTYTCTDGTTTTRFGACGFYDTRPTCP
jgi:hypothetical protein